MSNNLRDLEKKLRSYVKRVKGVTYNNKFLIAFLLTGVISLSASDTDKAIAEVRDDIDNATVEAKKAFLKSKKINNKLIKNTSLELIKLLEQGDQVVKSQWSSWQVGINGFVGSNRSYYKGKGDKNEKLYLVNKNYEDSLSKYISTFESDVAYGTTSLKLVEETPVTAKMRVAFKVNIDNKNLTDRNIDIKEVSVPHLYPKTITSPIIKEKVISISPVPNPPSTDVGYQAVPNDLTGYYNNPNLSRLTKEFIEEYKTKTGQTTINGKPIEDIKNTEISFSELGINGGLISQLELTSGEYNLYMKGAGEGFEYNFKNADAANKKDLRPINYFNGSNIESFTNKISEYSELPDSDSGVLNVEAFYRHGGKAETTIGEKVVINMVGNNENSNPLNTIFYLGNNSSANNPDSKLINKATVNLYGNKIAVVNIDNVSSPGNITFKNEGKIVGYADRGIYENKQGNADIGNFIFGAYSYGDGGIDTIENTPQGKVLFYAPNSVGWAYSSSSNQSVTRSSINNGELKLYGHHSLGISVDNDVTPEQMAYADIQLNTPIEIQGDESVGASIKMEPNNSSNNFLNSKWNIKIGGLSGKEQDSKYGNTKTSLNKVEESVGLNFDFDNYITGSSQELKINKYKVSLENDSKNSVGIRVGRAKINLDDSEEFSSINLSGESNVGFLADGSSAELKYTNDKNSIKLIEGSKDNVVFASINSGKINVEKEITLKANSSQGLVGLYAKDSGSSIKLNKDINYNQKGDSSVLAYAINDGKIEFNNTPFILPSLVGKDVVEMGVFPEIKVNVEGKESIAFYSDNSKIEANNSKIKVNEGSTIAYSKGVNGTINLQNSILDYSGKGYSLYVENGGKINADNSTIILRDNSVGVRKSDLSSISLNNSNIVMMSNDAVPFDIGSVETVNVSNFSSGIGIGSTINIIKGKDGNVVYNKYKNAFIDGVTTLNVDIDLNQKNAIDDVNETSTDLDKKGSYDYYRRYIIQRANIDVNANKQVTSILDTTDLDVIGKDNLIALEADSSSQATSNLETSIKLGDNVVVTSDRVDAGRGAIGLYTNYGKIITNKTSTINVEKENNIENSNAVGIYSVNGSEVKNDGTINVGGDSSTGIIGLAYRSNNNGTLLVNEFGVGALNQGEINILNKGNINLSGKNSTGIFADNNNSVANNSSSNVLNDSTGIIKMSEEGSIGIFSKKTIVENQGEIELDSKKGIGIFGTENSSIVNSGDIKLRNAASKEENVGIYTKDIGTKIVNNGNISAGDYSYGIFGKNIDILENSKIELKNNSVGIYSDAKYSSLQVSPTINILNGSKIEVGNNSDAIIVSGENQNVENNGVIKIGEFSHGYIVKGKGTILKSLNTDEVELKDTSMFIFSEDTTGNIENKTAIKATGNNVQGIYSAGTVSNLANIDFSNSVGSISLYSDKNGVINNGILGGVSPIIKVGLSDTLNDKYSIGMATGYVNDNGILESTGKIVNYGTIKVEKDNGIGMYAIGNGSVAENHGSIELSGKNTIGMYLGDNAVGINYGNIVTVPNSTNSGIKGVVVSKGSILKNYGMIKIEDGVNLTALELDSGTYEDTDSSGNVGVLIGKKEEDKQLPTSKEIKNLKITAPGDGTATIMRDNVKITPISIDVEVVDSNKMDIKLDNKVVEIGNDIIPKETNTKVSSLGMYVDTSGINYTKPIIGIEKIKNLDEINLLFGTEATKYTGSKDIEIGQNILAPYNTELEKVTINGNKNIKLNSTSLTWIATATQNTDDTLKNVYLSKIPYTEFTLEGDTNTYNFLDGLEQRYGVEKIGSRENKLFSKLNELGKAEGHIFVQAVDEMKGNQYANIQQRINESGKQLNQEFKHLMDDWANPTKESNKVKVFGTKTDYTTDTAGIKDYRTNSYGVAYVHEDETLKLGESSGWYTGAIYNRFRFKDIGKSKEEQNMVKLGVFKSKAFDNNGSLRWKVAVDGFAGLNEMDRKYLVVDDIFNSKSRYYTYGVGVRNELSKDLRLSEHFSFVPYGALDLEYGRFSKIKEKTGEVRLEVKGDDYISVKPEIGAELKYRTNFAKNSKLVASIGVAYENELGRVNDAKNKARVGYTTADWYNLVSEKEDRKGNIKTDVKFGIENGRVGVTVNAGYDTKAKNVRGGVGVRAIY